MIAAELYSNTVSPISSLDTVQLALERMAECKLSHFPIVDGKKFIGLVKEDDLLEIRDTSESINNSQTTLIQAFVTDEAHIYEIIQMFNQLKLSIVPVIKGNKEYLGLISISSILVGAGSIFSSNETGGILVLEISNRDNSLAQMAQIVEADNAQILSSYVRNFPESTRMEVTIKINKSDVSGLIAAFERYNYHVSAVYNAVSDGNDTDNRYNSLMNYLNV